MRANGSDDPAEVACRRNATRRSRRRNRHPDNCEMSRHDISSRRTLIRNPDICSREYFATFERCTYPPLCVRIRPCECRLCVYSFVTHEIRCPRKIVDAPVRFSRSLSSETIASDLSRYQFHPAEKLRCSVSIDPVVSRGVSLAGFFIDRPVNDPAERNEVIEIRVLRMCEQVFDLGSLELDAAFLVAPIENYSDGILRGFLSKGDDRVFDRL